MEREGGGGIGMGNTCKPMAVSFQCMTKSTTKKKNNGRAFAFSIISGNIGQGSTIHSRIGKPPLQVFCQPCCSGDLKEKGKAHFFPG